SVAEMFGTMRFMIIPNRSLMTGQINRSAVNFGRAGLHGPVSLRGAVRVRFGSKADMCIALAYVRFTPNSDVDCVFRHVCFSGHNALHMPAFARRGIHGVPPAAVGLSRFADAQFLSVTRFDPEPTREN